ncbi:MAG: capsular polysaccharide biosynthesis protein CapF [Candidatus Fimenecus sp.]
MKVLVTGAKGFVGKNLVAALKNIKDGKDKTTALPADLEICVFDIDTEKSLLDAFCADCDFVFNLAGVNRPQNEAEFAAGNFGFASELLDTLKKHGNTCPVMLSSSTQAVLDNPYGKSKKAGEDLFFRYAEETGTKVLVYRFPNLFGKWCRPNYNSAVATFCHNIAHDLPITVNDRSHEMTLVYIDDLVEEMLRCLLGNETRDGAFCRVPTEHKITLGEIADLLYSFKESRETKRVPDMTDGSFSKKLYSTYLSYLPTDQFSYPLKMNIDERGSFTEILRTANNGQFSVNISKPGITKGQHWHHTKNEKFLVVSGKGVIRFRKIDNDEVLEYFVSGEKLEVVDIPVGYTHNIENLGDTDMVTFMWCNECFNPEKPDTFFLEV